MYPCILILLWTVSYFVIASRCFSFAVFASWSEMLPYNSEVRFLLSLLPSMAEKNSRNPVTVNYSHCYLKNVVWCIFYEQIDVLQFWNLVYNHGQYQLCFPLWSLLGLHVGVFKRVYEIWNKFVGQSSALDNNPSALTLLTNLITSIYSIIYWIENQIGFTTKSWINKRKEIIRVGKSIGTWEPSSQNFFWWRY